MPTMLLEVMIGEHKMECAEFKLHEGAAAKAWVDGKIAFYSPMVIDMLVTIKAHGEYEEMMTDLQPAPMYVN
jgi:hypothetical protein